MQKRGFTLIELLAVVVILSVIALIATPIIIKLVERSKEESVVDSAYGLVDAASFYYMNNLKDTSDATVFIIENRKQLGQKLEYKGLVENGKIILNADGTMSLCITTGKYSAYKNQTEDKVTSGVGSCEYDEETGIFSIVSSGSGKICSYDIGQTFIYTYTGSSQEFKVPCSGHYSIELWGASGGGNYGGNGSYTKGDIVLNKNASFLIEVGGTGKIQAGGYNGGGNPGNTTVNLDSKESFGGGGATDIRLNESHISRIMVAGGGGGQTRNMAPDKLFGCYSGGTGGILSGNTGCSIKGSRGDLSTGGTGGTQIAGGTRGTGSSGVEATNGSFGQGGTGGGVNSSYVNKINYVGSGGGGGYYGGGGGGRGGYGGTTGDGGHFGGAGGGGSSFISGYTGCNAVSNSSTIENIIHSGDANHYSGYIFTDGIIIDGNSTMPTYDHLDTMTGNKGDGYAKITYLGNEI